MRSSIVPGWSVHREGSPRVITVRSYTSLWGVWVFPCCLPRGSLFDVASALDDLLQVSAAARRLGLSPQRLRTLADEGQIACVRTPFGRLFDAAEVERFRRTRNPPQPIRALCRPT
ncbi:MAG: MerR family transcriptional regulator [Nitrososphaerales archaeon]